MPGILTHYLCGDTVIKKLDNPGLVELLQKYRPAFNLGTQGPDILFYHGAWPWVKSEGIKEIGEEMHDKGSGAFFKNSLQYIKNQVASDKDTLTAYLCGFACHYSLDLHTHPYIFYKTGFVREGEPDTKKFSYYHRSFETTLDVLMLARLKNTTPGKIDAASLIKVSPEEALGIAKLYESVLKSAMNISITIEEVQKSISDMVRITHALRDRTGIKKKLFTALERSIAPYPLASSMIHPVSVSDELDYLNLECTDWHLPWDENISLNSTLLELFEDGADEAEDLCEALWGCIYNEFDMDAVMELLGNRSFSSGIDCDSETTFRCYNLLYE